MKQSIVLKAVLLISGLVALSIGAAILLAPVPFYATSGIELGPNISLLNETRATGGAMVAGGLLILSGIAVPALTLTAIVTATTLYLAYGLSRLMSMAIDGMPDDSLVMTAGAEIIVGLACLAALVRYRTIA